MGRKRAMIFMKKKKEEQQNTEKEISATKGKRFRGDSPKKDKGFFVSKKQKVTEKQEKNKEEKAAEEAKAATKKATGTKKKFNLNFLKNKSILGTLIKAFMVPIVLIIILGVTSSTIASRTIKSKVEESSQNTISAMAMYCDLLTSTISSKSQELVMSNDLSSYYDVNYRKNDGFSMQYWRSAKKYLLQVKSSVQYLYSYHIIPEGGSSITSVTENLSEDIYDKFLESPEGQFLMGSEIKRNAWLGYHSAVDQDLGISEDSYGITFFQKFFKANTYFVMDISTETVEEMLNGMDFGENSITAMISQDDREVVRIRKDGQNNVMDTTEPVFTDKEFYTKSKTATEAGSEYVKYNGKSYLYIYAPVGETGIILCGLMPQDNIVSEVVFIRNICIVMVIFACIIAFIIGSSIATGMSKSVKVMTTGLDKVSEGDLTQEFKIKRKDEFGILANGLNDMLASMRALMADMHKFGNRVNDMTVDVAIKAESIDTSVKEISIAVEEVAKGAQTQAQEADSSNHRMSGFAEKIDSVYAGTGEMGNTIDKATTAIEQGRVIVDDLSRKSGTTVEITKVLVDNINDVQERSSQIVGFIDTVNNIAEQTNLLSLNASIEAARAGEHGRGFAVVAEEIRKLADESMRAGKNIKDIVENIMETTQKTTDSAKEAETIVNDQAKALEETIEVFGEINSCVEGLVNGLKNIADSLQTINTEKEQIQDSIGNISVVSEEAAAASQEVTATLENQVKVISDLAHDVEHLRQEAEALDQSISRFRV